MAWPARLNGNCPLRLVFEGAILRVSGDLMVVSVERPEFRTAGKGMSTEPRRNGVLARVAQFIPSWT